MAVDVLSSISAALTTEFSTGFARQYAQTAITLGNMNVVRGQGKSVNWDVEPSTGGATATAYTDGSAVAAGEYGSNPIIPATLAWGLYRSSFQLSDLEVAAAMSSLAQDKQVADILGERMAGAMHVLARQMNSDLFNGTGTDGSGNPNLVGFFGGAVANSGSYAGISRSSYPEFASSVLANGGTPRPLTVSLMDTVEQNIFTASRMRPNLLIATPALRRKYKELFEFARRTVTDGMAPLRYGTGTEDYFYGTAPIVRDPDTTAGKLLFLNTDWCDILQLPPGTGPYADAIRTTDEILRQQDGNGDSPLPLICMVSPLARVGQAQPFSVSIQLQLRVRRPNTAGVLADLDES